MHDQAASELVEYITLEVCCGQWYFSIIVPRVYTLDSTCRKQMAIALCVAAGT